MSGIELVNKVRQELSNYENTPFLCITANVFHDKRYECFDGFILKPFTEQDLFYKIVIALGLEVIVTAPKIEPVDKVSSENTGEVASLSDLEKFADGDKDMIRNMVEDLISNNRLHMLQMNNALAANDRDRLAAIAHKMTPSFAHVKAWQVTDLLNKLEYEQNSFTQPEIKGIVKQLNQASSEVFTWLEAQGDVKEATKVQVNN